MLDQSDKSVQTNKRMLNVCIVTPPTLGPTEGFIQAAIDRLPANVIRISGYHSEFFYNDISLCDLATKTPGTLTNSLLNLLPRFLEFRVRRNAFPKITGHDAIAAFLRQQAIDVVLAEYGPIGAFMAPACKSTGVPLVAHFHGFDASRYSAIEEHREGYVRLFQTAKSVIAVSQRMRNDIIALNCPPEKVEVVYYGPHPDFFNVQPDYSSTSMLMVGRLTEKKAPHLSLLAFSQIISEFPSARLRIIGDGELRSVCRDLVGALGIKKQVDFLGVAGPDVIRKELSRSAFFVQHSVTGATGDSEGTPVAVIEAGAAGLAVVSTTHAGIPDVVVHEETGLLCPEGDVSAMANSMRRLLSNRNLAATLGQNARKRIEHHFSMDHHIAGVHQVLQNAAVQK